MKEFEYPEILIVRYGIEDVITTSDPDNGDDDLGWA